MKNTAYALLQRYIRFGFYCYYQRVDMDGIDKMSRKSPTLILPNHQNALLDPLLIAAYAPRSPYFLTRSDVFRGPRLKAFFSFLRMMPIYRIRDGRETLGRNQEIFRNCASILENDQSIVMFPEANHNLERRVRPLSKGFTRILFEAKEACPGIDLKIMPVGLNYQKGEGFPDRVRFIFGEPLEVERFLEPGDERGNVLRLRNAVSKALKKLTTDIDHPEYYSIVQSLEARRTDFTDPVSVNSKWPQLSSDDNQGTGNVKRNFCDLLIEVLNFPVIMGWRLLLKPKVPEPEFTATYRFLFALLLYPLFYLSGFLILGSAIGVLGAFGIIISHFLINLLYVKIR